MSAGVAVGGVFNRRLAALAVGVALYYLIDWTPLQNGCRRLVAGALSLAGLDGDAAAIAGAPALVIAGGRAYAFTKNCAYVALFLLAAPFVWRFGLRPLRNLARVAIFGAGLLALDVVRLTAAILLHQGGVAWTWAHDAPDVLIHAAVLAAAILPTLRADDDNAAQRSKTTRPSTIV